MTLYLFGEHFSNPYGIIILRKYYYREESFMSSILIMGKIFGSLVLIALGIPAYYAIFHTEGFIDFSYRFNSYNYAEPNHHALILTKIEGVIYLIFSLIVLLILWLS